MQGFTRRWPDCDSSSSVENGESDSDDEASSTSRSRNDVWEAVDFGTTMIDQESAHMETLPCLNDESNSSTPSTKIAPPEKWTHLRNWCLPRARKRLMFEDGAAGKKPRSLADQKTLALAYYVVSWQNFQRRPNKTASPKAFPFSVAVDLICQAAQEFRRGSKVDINR